MQAEVSTKISRNKLETSLATTLRSNLRKIEEVFDIAFYIKIRWKKVIDVNFSNVEVI